MDKETKIVVMKIMHQIFVQGSVAGLRRFQGLCSTINCVHMFLFHAKSLDRSTGKFLLAFPVNLSMLGIFKLTGWYERFHSAMKVNVD